MDRTDSVRKGRVVIKLMGKKSAPGYIYAEEKQRNRQHM